MEAMKFILITVFLTLLAICEGGKGKLKLNGGIKVKTKLLSEDRIEFKITAPTTTWIAFSFGDSMEHSDMFIINLIDDHPMLTDAHGLLDGSILEDDINNYQLSTTFKESENVYTVTRLLDTGDSNDYTIIDGDHHMNYASGNIDGDASFSIENEGEFDLLVDAQSRSIGLRSPFETHKVPRRRMMTANGLFHAYVSYLIWCWFSLIMIVTGRYAKYFYSIRIWVHAIVGVIILILNMMLSELKPNYKHKGTTLGDIHEDMAEVITTFTEIVIILGVSARLCSLFLRHCTVLTQYIKSAHIISSYFTILYSHFAFLTGLYLYDSPVIWLYYFHLCVFFLLYLSIEIIFRRKQSWKYTDLQNMLFSKPLPKITMFEFENCVKSGKQYCLMGRYVIDITYYKYEHPGSTYVMQMNIGKDVGKYFYGAYSMEDWVKPCTHSRTAVKILVKLAVAEIQDMAYEGACKVVCENFEVSESEKDMMLKSVEDNKHSNKLFKIRSKKMLMGDIYSIRLKSSGCQFKSYYRNLEYTFQYFLISSCQNQVSRYYTICNCMNQKYYEIYMDAFDSVLEDRDMTLKPTDPIHEEYDDFIEFIIKVYYETKIGLAKQIDNATGDDKFIVDGPMGKNLDFGMPNPEGTYLLFVGGTGILPYMDIFAYMARKIIAEKTNIGQIFPGETFDCDLSKVNFIVYGYYPDEPRACGYEFTKKVADVFEKLGVPEQFKFNCVFTRAGGKRLNKEDLKDLLEKHAQNDNVKRVWVCGPPTMNNMFHKYMSMVKDTLKIEEEHIDIL